jgi:hypothetical protein
MKRSYVGYIVGNQAEADSRGVNPLSVSLQDAL